MSFDSAPITGFKWADIVDLYHAAKCAVVCWWKDYDCSSYTLVDGKKYECMCRTSDTYIRLFEKAKCD